jgi:hypothetical protein
MQTPTNMKKLRAGQRTMYTLAVVFGLILSFSTAASQAWPTFLCVIGAFVGAFVLLVISVTSLIVAAKQWKVSFLSWMGPVALCAGFILIIPADLWIGGKCADWRFKGNLQTYALLVDDIRSGKVAAPKTLSIIEMKVLPSGVESIQAARESDGSVLVLFLTGTGFPLHHSGYIFNGSGTNLECNAQFNTFSNRANLKETTGGWYYFSD